MVGSKKSGWEVMKIQETENDPEAFWRMIKMLLGKEKVDNEETFIFDDKGEKGRYWSVSQNLWISGLHRFIRG